LRVTVRILVADDDPDYRFLIASALATDAELELVGDVTTAAELIDATRDLQPDIVLLDASLDAGAAAAAGLPEVAPDVTLVLTSSLPARLVAARVADVGARGSLAKDVPLALVPAALRELTSLAEVAERAVRTATATLPPDVTSPRQSRFLARDTLAGWCDPTAFADIELLISELVANGVEHAETHVEVRIAVTATTIRIEVSDRHPDLPVMRTPEAHESSGRGMRIVDQTASRWGVQVRRTCKCVWFEVPRRPMPVAR
jgi:DNA-binding NarL/FixJ family response regulator